MWTRTAGEGGALEPGPACPASKLWRPRDTRLAGGPLAVAEEGGKALRAEAVPVRWLRSEQGKEEEKEEPKKPLWTVQIFRHTRSNGGPRAYHQVSMAHIFVQQ